MASKLKTIVQAKKTVYRLLKLRPRSEKELRDSLTKKEFDPLITDQTLDYFKQIKLIDDASFAGAWVASRALRPFGVNRIRFELKDKGIAPEIIDRELKRFKEDVDEESVVLELARRRQKLIRITDPVKVKQRLFGFLMRKGFNASVVAKVIRKL